MATLRTRLRRAAWPAIAKLAIALVVWVAKYRHHAVFRKLLVVGIVEGCFNADKTFENSGRASSCVFVGSSRRTKQPRSNSRQSQ